MINDTVLAYHLQRLNVNKVGSELFMTLKQESKALIWRACSLLAVIALMQGCASSSPTTPTPPPSNFPKFPLKPIIDDRIPLDALKDAIKRDPDSADLRLKLAQAQFDEHNYPAAIEAANQAIAMKAPGSEARSILFVSSMRLAMDTLAQIRSESQLNGSTRTEAEKLVKSLRETLGESVLLPPVATPGKITPAAEPKQETPTAITVKPKDKKPAVPPLNKKPEVSAADVLGKPAVPNKPTAIPAAPTKPSGNPFGLLK